jgi:hypothetical protein
MDYPFAFIDEVGFSDDPSQPFVAIGLLKIRQPDIILEDLHKHHFDYTTENKAKRRKIIDDLLAEPKALSMDEYNSIFLSTRHHEFKFENITYPSLARYKELIDILVTYPIDFSCLLVDKSKYPLHNFTHFWEAYSHYISTLIQKINQPDEKPIIIADWVNRPKDNSQTLHQYIMSMDQIANTIQADSQSFLLLQMCDLLMGTVVFERKHAAGVFAESNKLKARLDFVEYFKEKMTQEHQITTTIFDYEHIVNR